MPDLQAVRKPVTRPHILGVPPNRASGSESVAEVVDVGKEEQPSVWTAVCPVHAAAEAMMRKLDDGSR
jgi:hypothetical protein